MDVLPLLNEMAAPDLPGDKRQALKQRLAAHLNDLLLHDFPALVQVLYRVDVPEKKLKAVLKANPGKDAGELMADLLVERQLEKMAARAKFRPPEGESAEERWQE